MQEPVVSLEAWNLVSIDMRNQSCCPGPLTALSLGFASQCVLSAWGLKGSSTSESRGWGGVKSLYHGNP